MKKIVLTGIVLVLVMMFVITCEEAPETGAVEYTDVVYSQDGSEITLYIDGVGVPVTPAQRAINRELAMMAFDYFEVVFQAATGATPAANTVARAKWELGERAGIYDVPRGGTTGINYGYASGTALASMFVGKKSDKTLLGIGYVSNVDNASTATTTVTGDSKSITFSIAAILTGLLVAGEAIDPGTGSLPTNGVAGVMANSFAAGANFASFKSTVRQSVNTSPLKYPKYVLEDKDDTVEATYTFSYVGTNNVFALAKMYNAAPDLPKVLKRVPRFMNGGRYMEPKDGWTTVTKVSFGNSYETVGANTAFNASFNTSSTRNVVPLQFKTIKGGTGVFSFYIEIPVYNLNNVAGTYGDVTAVSVEKWYIRTGVGSELYSLDDGAANGGCVFMQVGDSSSANWIDIDWVWL